MTDATFTLIGSMHARPAAAIAHAAAAADGPVRLVTDTVDLDATSVMALMAADLPAGTLVRIVTDAADSAAAVVAAYRAAVRDDA